MAGIDMNNVEVYFYLFKDVFESIQKRASQEAIDSDPNDEEKKNELYFKGATIKVGALGVEDKSDEIQLSGEFCCFGKEIGWIDLKIPFNQEMAKDVIERYIKKLQKLKTVLEATKD